MNPAVYTRPAKPLCLAVRRRQDFAKPSVAEAPEIVAVDRATECHVTPPDVARRMVEYLGGQGDGWTLEPSAGTGNLSRALIGAGYDPARIMQVERHHRLAAGLGAWGNVAHADFLEWEPARRFEHIVMNPPFSDVRKHVARALGMLAEGGSLVALVPITYQNDKSSLMETLDGDTFSTAKVNTKIIRF